ncbi:MAG: FCD domain-containing protein [Rhodoferax sp.]
METKETETQKGLSTQAFEQLRVDIIQGHLRPSERLRIQGLSEHYHVGATAIREALSRLVSDGMVDFEDKRGFCVSPVSRDELLDLTQTRIDIESLAMRYAVQRGDLGWESNLLSAFHRLSRTPVPYSPEKHVAWADAHQQFHEALVAGCGSPWLLRLCRLLYDKSERYRNVAERHPLSADRDTVDEHKQLLDGAMARDADLLSLHLAEHYGRTTSIILETNFGNITVTGESSAPRALVKTNKA